jgi:ribonuclease BN (tRNA processing enzyme)
MQLAFLGTGAAYSLERYNGAVLVDRHVLLDAGAPILPHMHRLGLDPGGVDVVFLSHFHGDHLAGLIPFLCYRAFEAPDPLTIVSPPGGAERVSRLLAAAWGDEEWASFAAALGLRHQQADGGGEVAGVRFTPVRLDHGRHGGTGYRLWIGDRLLAYAGDTEATARLDHLVQGADVAITEATGPGAVPSHTSFAEAGALTARHPKTRFIFNHVFAGDPPGAAHDLEVVEV